MTIYVVLSVVGVVLLLVSVFFDGVIDGLLEAGPEWLTGVSIGAFLAVLGMTGLFCTSVGLSATVTAIVASVTAFAVAAVANVVALKVMRSGSAEALTADDLVGLEGTSILGAAAGALGEVMLTVRGHPLKVNGRCSEAVSAGDRVRVVAATSITSVMVERV